LTQDTLLSKEGDSMPNKDSFAEQFLRDEAKSKLQKSEFFREGGRVY